jgi:hypothetical protein
MTGGTVNIQYFEPLSRGFARMKKALFNPIDLKIWFVVGFTAFLSGLTDCGGNGGSGGKGRGTVDWEEILYFPQRAWEWLAAHPVWATVIVFGAVLVFVLVILIAWCSSRGKFMFLDNVVHDRSQVVAPWNEYRTEGNSLFLWCLVLGAVVFVIVIGYLVQSFITLQGLYEGSEDLKALIVPAILMFLGLIAILLLNGFIKLLLSDFVVPIMYRDRITTLKAIQRFLPLFLSHLFYFLGYALFVLFVVMVVVIGIVIAGFVTCCVGFVLLAIPYINSIVLLPISYTIRAFSVEFLEQFGSEYRVFPKDNGTPPSAEPTIA